MAFRSTGLAVSVLFAYVAVPRGSAQFRMSNDCGPATCELSFNPIESAAPAAISGAPYSGSLRTQNVQTLPDGTHLSRPPVATTTTWRDSSGRVRTEEPAFPFMRQMPATPGVKPWPDFTIVQIQDPVAGYQYVLDSVNQVAHRAVFQPRQVAFRPRTNPIAANGDSRTPQKMANGIMVVNETLGTQTVAGVSATGRRTSMTYPAGSSLGNDRPMTTVNEFWTDPRTGVLLLLKNSGLVNGTMSIENYSTAEPDAALFMVPAGYQVMDETGSFKIVLPRN